MVVGGGGLTTASVGAPWALGVSEMGGLGASRYLGFIGDFKGVYLFVNAYLMLPHSRP